MANTSTNFDDLIKDIDLNANPNDVDHSAVDNVNTNAAFGHGYNSNVSAKEFPAAIGTPSMFNNYTVFVHAKTAGDYTKLYDRAGNESITDYKSRNPSASNIVEWSKDNKPTPYSLVDFLYCKYYGMIPNNYLVTLRRFPIPIVDSLNPTNPMPPIAQAVTFLGEEPGNKMGEILKMTFGQNWREIEARVQEVMGNEKDFKSAIGGGGTVEVKGFKIPNIGDIGGSLTAVANPKEYSLLAAAQTDYSKKLYTEEGPYGNKVYGPVNVIDKTFARNRGMHFESDMKLNFHYSLKSIGNVNPKMAMLDIIANFLTLTYNNAKFWGGAIRYFPQHPQHPFLGNQNDFYNGNLDNYIGSVVKELGGLSKTVLDGFTRFLSDPLTALKELATNVGQFQAGKIAARDRPAIISMQSLLTGAPVGEWHLVIGNPMNPTAMIGNLICTDVEMEFGEILGADDFPTEIKFTVTLKHGRPRDKGDIESMFNHGLGRMYYGINDDLAFSSTNNSVIDTSKEKGNISNTTQSNNVYTPSPTTAQAVRDVRSMWAGWAADNDLTKLKIAGDWVGDTSIVADNTTNKK